MAVHTELSAAQVAEACALFGLSGPFSFQGIPEGSINTLYRVETAQGRFVLRLSEGRTDREVEFELELMAHLAGASFPCARPLPARDGPPWAKFLGKHVCVFHGMAGEPLRRAEVTPDHCERIGEQLGHLHVLGEAFAGSLPNRYGPAQVLAWAEELLSATDPEVRAAAPEWVVEARAPRPALPMGAIHADLFLDNVLWIGGRVSAVLDFEMACTDALALDVAIALCAWCYDEAFVPARAQALVRGYERRRVLSRAEREGLYPLSRFAAARYAVTRVRDFHLSPLPPERLVKKDWRRYRDRLRALVAMGPAGFARLVSSTG